MNKKIRVGIVGAGSITKFRHAPEYAANPYVEIAGFYDHNPDRAEALIAVFGGQYYPSLEDLLNDESIDAISDCSSNEHHVKVSSSALLKGKHVLCEKPMTITSEEGRELLEARDRSGKILMIDHNQRLTKVHQKVYDMLRDGRIGRPLSFNISFSHRGPEYWGATKSPKTWFFDKTRSGLGVIADLGVHKFDLIRYLFGEEVVEVQSVANTLDKKDSSGSFIGVADNLNAMLRLASGVIGSMRLSWTNYGSEDNSLVIYGSTGVLKVYTDPNYPLIIERHLERELFEMESIQTNDNQTSTGIIDAFVDAIIHHKKPLITGEDGLRSIQIAEAVTKSAHTMKWERVDY